MLLCIPYDIIIEIIVLPRYYDYFSDCGYGYNDYFGFYDYWWGSFWDYGGFTSNRPRSCSYTNIFYIARIISRVIRCLPTSTNCTYNTDEILPSGFRPRFENPFVSGANNMMFTCTTDDQFGNRVSGQTVNFRLDTAVADSGGHEFHTGTRPRGTLDRTTARSNSNGETQFKFTAPIFGGSTRVVASIPGGNQSLNTDVKIKVPGLQQLNPGDNYRVFGGTNKHPFNHFGKPTTVAGLQQIADDYKNEFYPNGWIEPPVGTPIDSFDARIDYYKIHYNDISVRSGGKFEISGDWRSNGSHDEHRVGINCDTRSKNIPTSRWARINEIFAARGSTDTNNETATKAPHWHLRFVFGAQTGQAPATSPYNDFPAFLPGTIEAEQFDNGNNTSAFYIPFTGEIDPEEKPVDVNVVDAPDGSRYISSTSGGQWLNYTVNISSSGSYSFDTRIASSVGSGAFHFEVDGVDKTGSLGIPYTGSSNAFQSVVVDDIYLDAGQHTVRLVIEGAQQNVASFDSFTVNPYFVPEICNPPYWEVQNCQYSGGYWDSYFCQCNYGMY